MSLESLIDDSGQLATISVEAASGTPPQSTMGGTDRTGSWPAVAIGIPCLLNNKSSQLQAYPGRNDARAQVYSTRVYFSYDPTPSGFTTRMRITVTQTQVGGDVTDLGIYQIVSVQNPNSMGRIYEVDVEKVRT